MSVIRKHLGILLAVLLFVALVAPAGAAPKVVNAATADSVLQPGDVLFKFVLGKYEFTNKLIQFLQTGWKAVMGAFNKSLKSGDPKAFHVAMYVGKGETSEAHGGSLQDAKVGTRSLNAHDGYLLQVFRPRDRSLAARAVEVARRWATGKMKYLLPFRVLSRASFGPNARADALVFGRDAGREGGPTGFEKMFCSQFVASAYQAAVVAPQLAAKPNATAAELTMPAALSVHAANASAVILHGLLKDASTGKKASWDYVGEVVIRK